MTAGAQFLLAAVLMLPVGMASGGMTWAAVEAALPELVILGGFSTAAAFGIQTVAQRFTTASHAAVIVSAEYVFGATGAMLFLGECLSASAALGALIVLAAIITLAVQSGPRAHSKHLEKTKGA